MIKLNDFDLNKTIRVSHTDADGTVPFILDKFFNITFAKSISTNYGENLELESIQSGLYDNIIYTDFTPSENIRKAITEKQMNVIVFDHHIAVKDEMETFVKEYGSDKIVYVFDNDRCGTKIYYDYLMDNGYKDKTNSVVEYIVNLIDVYDLYKVKDPLFKEAEKCNRLLYSTCAWYILKTEPTNRIEAYKFFINSMLWKMQNADNFFFNKIEIEKINKDIKKENDIFNELIANASTEISTRKDSEGKYFAVFNCNSKISAVAHKLMEKYKKLDYCVIINQYDENEPKISLRSRDDFDLLRLNHTKGHKLACGIDADDVKDMKEFVKLLKNKTIYELGYKD